LTFEHGTYVDGGANQCRSSGHEHQELKHTLSYFAAQIF
jgi:hypothetical protein